MSTPGTSITTLRRSKRLKRRNLTTIKFASKETVIDEDDYNVVFNTFPLQMIWKCEIGRNTRRICTLDVKGMRRMGGYELPEDFWTLSALKELTLERLGLSHIPSSIGMLQNIEKIDLSSNLIVSPLPDEIGNLKNLSHLILSFNEITHLPVSIGDLTNLKVFQIGYNPLSSLPDEIGNLKNVEQMELNATSVSQLPASFGNLERLKTLDIRKISEMKQLPKELYNLPNLECVTVCEDSLMEELGNVKALRKLSIYYDRETSFDFSSVEHLQQLNVLDVAMFPRNFDVRQLGVVRKLPNLKSLSFVNDYLLFEDPYEGFRTDQLEAHDLTQRDLQFILDLVRGTSLYEVDLGIMERIPEMEYALACNCFQLTTPFSSSNGNVLPFLNVLWPRMLTNAGHAFKPSLKARVRMEPHDAMYKLLSEGADSFVQMLYARSSKG